MRVLTLVAAFATLLASAVAQQDVRPEPTPPVSSEVLGPPLIAWTQFQTPQPVQQPKPQPVPLPEREPEQQPDQPPSQASPSGPSEPQPSSQTLEGVIVKDSRAYVLKTTDKLVYQLDDQEKAKPFEGKKVKVTGTLAADGKLIHVQTIEVAS
jgi:hypothetical protein